MVIYPIYVPRRNYRGANPSKRQKTVERNLIAAKLEEHINARVLQQTSEYQIYLYHEIAHETGFDIEIVREICFGIDCGHNGFTVARHVTEK